MNKPTEPKKSVSIAESCKSYIEKIHTEITGKIVIASEYRGEYTYYLRNKGIRSSITFYPRGLVDYPKLKIGDSIIKPQKNIYGTVIKKEGDTLKNVQFLQYYKECIALDTSLHIVAPKEGITILTPAS